ncbi:TetR family transcriptional regulator [Nocardia mexicana]|uniref:TetR family transcriptional regulator n=2 Tax=Nocardia mexicana TaxID=279262 RepID=A0A370GQ35_9NOCA|nr:TetR family transcriptional regulator [Nocardia mexicana]
MVIDAAARTFADHGFTAASIQQIAARAGVVPSVVYDHFRSKRELYLELLDTRGSAFIERTVRPVESGGAEELVARSVDAFFLAVEEDQFMWRVLSREAPPDAAIAAKYDEIQSSATAAISALVQSFRPDSELIEGIPRATTNALVAQSVKATMNGAARWWFDNRDTPRTHVVATVNALLLSGLLPLANH